MKSADLKSSVRLPVIAAPMFLVSGVELTVAACRAGIIGSFPAWNARTPERLTAWLADIERRLAESAAAGEAPAPYAVNLALHGPNIAEEMRACEKVATQVVITCVGDPTAAARQVHEWGGLVFHDVINMRFAEKAVKAGVDGIIVVCGGAGGHAGATSPFALVPQVRRIFDGLIVVAGGIGDGGGILAAQAMGGDFAYMGTSFIATPESLAEQSYKEMLVGAETADIVYTDAISGLPASFLKQSLRAAGLDPEALPPRLAPMKPNLPGELKAWKDLWSAGHGVGLVKAVEPVAAIVRRLESEYRGARERLLRA
jgi:nitronate monooxygenase